MTQKILKTDFVHSISATGIIEAIKTYNVGCPSDLFTDLKIIYLIPEGTQVVSGDTVCILEASEIENAYKEAVKNLETSRAEYNKTVANLNLQYLLLDAQVKTIESSATISRLDSAWLAFASPTQKRLIELKLEKADIEKDKIQQKLAFLKRINDSELKKMESKIKQAENGVARQKEQLGKLSLTTANPGVVNYDILWTNGLKVKEGDIVWAGMPIIKIPDMSAMQINLQVNETKYKRIQEGQAVNIVIDAFPEIKLTGKISKKTPMGRPIARNSKIKVFEVFAALDSSEFSIQHGLSVTCDIILKSLPDTLVAPLPAVFEQDSIKYVCVADGGKYKKQDVTLGYSSDNHAVISSGLAENDEIALSLPPDKLILRHD